MSEMVETGNEGRLHGIKGEHGKLELVKQATVQVCICYFATSLASHTHSNVRG